MAETLPSNPPSEAEAFFGAALLALIEQITTVQNAAQAVQAAGGDAKRALLACVDDPNDRAALAMQWPMIAMMLGLPLA